MAGEQGLWEGRGKEERESRWLGPGTDRQRGEGSLCVQECWSLTP